MNRPTKLGPHLYSERALHGTPDRSLQRLAMPPRKLSQYRELTTSTSAIGAAQSGPSPISPIAVAQLGRQNLLASQQAGLCSDRFVRGFSNLTRSASPSVVGFRLRESLEKAGLYFNFAIQDVFGKFQA